MKTQLKCLKKNSLKSEKKYNASVKINCAKFYKDSTNNPRQSYQPLSQLKFSKFIVTEKYMEPPTGKIFFNDINI